MLQQRIDGLKETSAVDVMDTAADGAASVVEEIQQCEEAIRNELDRRATFQVWSCLEAWATTIHY